jgi:hypothetical protein
MFQGFRAHRTKGERCATRPQAPMRLAGILSKSLGVPDLLPASFPTLHGEPMTQRALEGYFVSLQGTRAVLRGKK